MLRTRLIVFAVLILSFTAASVSQTKPAPAVAKAASAPRKVAAMADAGRHMVRTQDKVFYLDRNGKVAIECKCDDAEEFHDGLALFYRKDKIGYMDRSGREVIPPQFTTADSFREGLATVATDEDHYIFIDKTGKQAIAKVFYAEKGIRPAFHEGLAPVMNEPSKKGETPKYGYIDKTGELVVPFVLDSADFFSGGMANVRMNGKAAIIDRDGNFVKKNLEDQIGGFSEGLASIKRGEKCGYIDLTFKVVIEPKFYTCAPFESGVAVVSTAPLNNFTFVDRSGKILTESRYNFVTEFADGRWGANIADKKWVFLDAKLNQSPSATYESIEPFSEGIAGVGLNGEEVFITTEGKVIFRWK